MKFIKKSIIGIIKWATRQDSNEVDKAAQAKVAYQSGTIGSNRHGLDMQGMNFTVFNAAGGKIIQFNRYNPATDRSYNQLYIVTDKEDLGQEIGQILTVESLTQ